MVDVASGFQHHGHPWVLPGRGRQRARGPPHGHARTGTGLQKIARSRISDPGIPTASCGGDLPAAQMGGGEGDLAGARPLFERALVIREKTLGPELPETAATLNNLAVILYEQGGLARARPLLQSALEIYEKALSPEHPNTMKVRSSLAAIHQVTGHNAPLRNP
jgi:tetratricopeptide (TPR) repeat protein